MLRVSSVSMTGRISPLRPRDASFARRCPERVQLDVLQPCEPLPDSPFLQKLYRAGDEYEDETIASLLAGVEGVEVIEAEDPDARGWHTVRALEAGARVVAGGRLPVDHEGHRVGEPDLLVRHGDGYLPIDVKSHMSLDRAKKEGEGTALVSELGAPFLDAAVTDTAHNPRKRVDDLLQLAHYRVLLAAPGFASSVCTMAGVCGSEGVIVWYDLDEPWLDPSEYLDRRPDGPLSALARYDLEFAHRLGVHLAAEAHLGDASAALLAEPIACTDCGMCRWRGWCGDRLEEAADLSLLPGLGVARRRLYMAQGVGDLHDLAALDWTTAELAHRKVDLADLSAKLHGLPPSTPLGTVIPKRKKQLEDLASLGFDTASDLDAIDRRTLNLCAAGASNVASQIELARARTGLAAAYRQRGVDRLEVPRGDVEVDMDMESTNDGCYLWGALVTDRRVPSSEARYVSFVTWDPDLAAGELVAFKDFWSWLTDERARAAAEGASFCSYCYSRGAEEGEMKRIAGRLGLDDEVAAFLASPEWVDLLEVVRRNLVTGRSMGLKETAPLAGFAWRHDDATGTLAMVNYDQAVDGIDPGDREEAQRWILEYNEDDVRATAALRAWLDGPAQDLPSITAATPAAAAATG
jgi:predicted RecB family nuclease